MIKQETCGSPSNVMTIEKVQKAISRLSDLKSEISDQFEDLKSEVNRRFASHAKRRDDEIFRPLPAPTGLDMSLMDALKNRRSQRNFSNEPIPDQMVANLLYAADGINRKGGKRTTPSALDWRETDLYLLKANGIWLWVPERNGLLFCAMKDVREETYLLNAQLTLPPLEIIYVTNYARTRSLLTNAVETIAPKIKKAAVDEADLREMRIRACHLDVGVKLQSVYLAAAAMGLACVARTGFSADKIAATLRLKPDEVVVAAQSLGYPAKSILDHLK